MGEVMRIREGHGLYQIATVFLTPAVIMVMAYWSGGWVDLFALGVILFLAFGAVNFQGIATD